MYYNGKFVRSPHFLCNSRDFLGFSSTAIRARNGTWFTENGSLRDLMKEGVDQLGLIVFLDREIPTLRYSQRAIYFISSMLCHSAGFRRVPIVI